MYNTIQTGNRDCHVNSRLLKTKQINENEVSKQTKIKIYKTFTRSVVIYGSETWTLTKGTKNIEKI